MGVVSYERGTPVKEGKPAPSVRGPRDLSGTSVIEASLSSTRSDGARKLAHSPPSQSALGLLDSSLEGVRATGKGLPVFQRATGVMATGFSNSDGARTVR